MKRRILAFLLAISLLTGNIPFQAFAGEGTPQETSPCSVEGCTYGAGHEGNCSNYVAPTEPCATEGCTYGAGHEGNCSNYVAPTEPCATEGCTYGAGHEGNCSNYAAPTEPCATEGCTYGAGHEGNCSNYVPPTEPCATEGCTYGVGHEGNCSNYAAPTEPCATEGYTYGAGHEGNCSNSVEPETIAVTGITLDQQLLLLTPDSEPVILTATVSPENAAEPELNWNVSNPSIVSVSEGVLTPLSEGTVMVTVTAGEHRAGCLVQVSTPIDHTPAAASLEVVDIATAEQLAAIDDTQESAAKSYRLTADIEASGSLSTRAFKGTLDGNGHTITVNGSPLFGTLNGTVANLVLKGSASASGYSNTGVLCKSISSNSVIRNCMLDVEITHTGTANTTFACGLGAFTNSQTKVSNCLVIADITTSGATASIIGGGSSVGTVTNCIGVGSGNFISKSVFDLDTFEETVSEQIQDTNTKLTEGFTPADYVDTMNANRVDGDLAWSVKDGVLGPWGAAESEVTPADPANVTVTIANKGELVVKRETITVTDHDTDGTLTVDDALYAAHEAKYEGGAAAGYASSVGQYGLAITKLWGYENGSFGYWLNDASCNGLTDEVAEGSYLVAFVYKDGTGWSDSYSRFKSSSYTATAGEALTVSVEKAGYDESWNTVFADFDGAAITANTDKCTIDGYNITFQEAGTYQIYASCEDPILVPAVAEVTVKSALVPADNDALVKAGMEGAQKWLKSNAPETYGYGNEWDIFSLVRSGETISDGQKLAYVESVEDNVGSLTKPTDLARVALTLRAIGEDPTDIGGVNLIARLYTGEGIDKIENGANEAIYALLVLDMDEYNIPTDAKWTRSNLIANILTYQAESGGFGMFSSSRIDVDSTAMAMQALAPYYSTNTTVKTALDRAVDYLKSQMDATTCTFGNANSDAQVLVALAAMGVDILDAENGFAKDVTANLITGITSYRDAESGGFYFYNTVNKMATYQSLLALESYRRFRDGENRLFDLSDVEESIEITFTSHTGEVTTFKANEGLTIYQGDWDPSDSNYGGYLTLEGATAWDDGEANLIYSGNKLYFDGKPAVYPITVSYGDGKSAEFTITVAEPRDAVALRLIAGEETVENGGKLIVQGRDEVIFEAQAQYEANGEWTTVSSDLLTYAVTDGDAYSYGAVFHANKPGDSTLTVTGLNQTMSITVTSIYVPVNSITPGIGGTITLHGRNANSSGGTSFLPTYAGVNVEPANASYAGDFTITSSDPSVGEYIASMVKGFVPYKAGTVTYTASIDDNGTTVTGTSNVTYVYRNPLKSVTAAQSALNLEVGKTLDAGLVFTGTLTDGHEITETGMVWTYDKDGIAEVTRASGGWKRDKTAPDNNMYFLSEKYSVKGLTEGTVTITGTPVDTTGGARSVTLTVTVSGGALSPADNDKLVKEGIEGAQTWLTNHAPETYGYNYEWNIFSLVRSGATISDAQKLAYLESVKAKAAELNKPTDIARVALALRVLGEDPTDVGGTNLIAKLYNSDAIENTSNEAVFALIALDMDGYSVPSGAKWNRSKLTTQIIAYQNSDGGFGLTNNQSASIDMTAMAMQALAPYYSTDPAVKTALDRALTYLRGKQTANGSVGDANADAQVLTALAAMGVDVLDADNGFVKNVATNLITGISSYRDEVSGGFLYGGSVNSMATCQSLYGLESYRRFRDKENRLFDLSDVALTKAPEYNIISGGNSTWSGGTAAVTITSDGSFQKFTGVKMDGNWVDPQHYTAKAGSTIVTFTEAYLKSLAIGPHIVTLQFTDGEVETLLTVARSDAQAAAEVMERIDQIGTVTKDKKDQIEGARAAYNKLTDSQKKLVTNYSTLVAAEKKLEALLGSVTVTATVKGCYAHNSDEDGIIHNGQTVWASETVTVAKGSTVSYVLGRLRGVVISNRGNYIYAVSNGSVTLAEFTNGAYSGWKYTVNGYEPSLGVDQQTVEDGDRVVLYYTDNFTGVSSGTAVRNVENLIKAIGTVTLSSEAKIKAARAAFDALTAAQKDEVSNYSVLEKAEKDLSRLKVEYVKKLIGQIGTVTLASRDQIQAARTAYDSLSPDEQKQVSNGSVLTAAETKYDSLRAEEVEAAIRKIDDLVTLTSEAQIQKAQKLYDALNEAQKKLVDQTLVKKLKDAKYRLAMLKTTGEDQKKAQQVVALIEKLGTITLDSREAVEAARKAYNALTDLQKELVTNYQDLLDAEDALAALERFAAWEDAYADTGAYLETLGVPNVGSVGGEWMVIGLVRSGREVSDGYYDNVLSFVELNIDGNQRLHNTKSTENSRLILALTALGKDVTDVGGHDLLQGLNDLDYVCKQGINGPIYALIALDSGNYPAPQGITRRMLLETILDAQLSDGGWALSGSKAQADMTAMALQALAPYRQEASVADAVEKGVSSLAAMQNPDGTFRDDDGSACETLAQILVALTALGIDPAEDARFNRNDRSALDVLLDYYVAGGGFKHLLTGSRDGMATEQAYYALTAYYRFLTGGNSLYDMTDVVDRGGDAVAVVCETVLPAAQVEEAPPESESGFPWWILTVLAVAAAGVTVVMLLLPKIRKTGKFQ